MNSKQRLVLIISILASFLASLDASVVNVALPAISRELGGGLAIQQWVSGAYLVTLGSLILVAGSLSDLFGRKKVLLWGIVGFGVASLVCAVAPSAATLIGARAFQGVFGALLVPSSLALIIEWFDGPAQSKAIGNWTAWTGIAFLIGPLVGGVLVDTLSWRWVFVINVIPTLVSLWLLRRLSSDKTRPASVDWLGAILGTFGLAGAVFALIEQPQFGWSHPLIYIPLVSGVLSFAIFIWWEKRAKQPMVPLSLFKVRNFTIGNLATTTIYAGLSVSTFLIIIFVQQVGHYSALSAGLTILPVTLIMFFLSPRFGALAGRFGPRFFMSVGPIIAAIGFLLLLRVNVEINYWTQLLPGILIFGLGLSMTVAPLTSAVLADINKQHAGIGSAINNAIARIAGLVAIASIGLVIGQDLTLDGFHRGIMVMVILLTFGGVISAIGIRNPRVNHHSTKR
jgi:EmrB/QacA subfamily drug resistance transporter